MTPSNPRGLNLSSLMRNFISFDKNGLYKSLFHYFSLVLFGFLIWIFLSSDYSSIPELYLVDASESNLFKSLNTFRILFWIGIILFIIVQVSAFLQKKLNKVNDASMIIFILGYIMAGIFIITSNPLHRFLTLYYGNQDPFRTFKTPYQVLKDLNYELYGGFLVAAIALFGFAFVLILLRKLNIKLKVIRHA